MVGTTEPVSGGSVATEAEVARGRFGFTISCDEAGSDRGYRPRSKVEIYCGHCRGGDRVNHNMLYRGG